MRTRYMLWVVGLAICLAVGIAVRESLSIAKPNPLRVNRATYEMIHHGMTETTVIALLGGPATSEEFAANMWFKEWSSEQGTVCITFRNGTVVDREFWVPVPVPPISFLARLREGIHAH